MALTHNIICAFVGALDCNRRDLYRVFFITNTLPRGGPLSPPRAGRCGILFGSASGGRPHIPYTYRAAAIHDD
jgi:hypothetical protein